MKKGFTLIELLSAIVIIAVVGLISVPVIRGLIQKIELKALEDSAYGLIEAGDLYYAQYANGTTFRFDKNEEENTLKDLTHKGDIKRGTVIINKRGKITVCVSDGKNSAYKNYNETKVTLAARKTCTIPTNTYVVYLDNQKTIDEYSNEELTNLVDSLVTRVSKLETENKSLQSQVQNIATIDDVYPVGSIYISANNVNPATLFGGTWEQIKDRFLLATGNTYLNGTTGGEATHILTTEEMPSHAHGLNAHTHSIPQLTGTAFAQGTEEVVGVSSTSFGIGFGSSAMSGKWPFSGEKHTHSVVTNSSTTGANSGNTTNVGGSKAHNNMPPYLTVNIWKRTA